MLHPGLVRLGVRQLLRTKKFFFAALVSLVPLVAGILLFVNDVQDSGKESFHFRDGVTDSVAFLMVLGTVPFVALMLAGGHLADEAEDRTLTYLLVRPIRRSTLFLSRYLPVAALTAALAAAQVFAFCLMRLLAYVAVGDGGRIAHETDPQHTYNAGLLILRLMPTAMATVMMEAAVLTALFGFVSIVTTRFHFFVNLVLVLFDAVFGSFGGAGLGALAITYWLRSFLQAVDPTTEGLVANGVVWPLVPIWLSAATALWLWLGVRTVARRDFNITSAAT